MGAQSQFTNHQDSWLKPIMAEYKTKLELEAAGQMKAAALLEWKKSKCEDFLREFEDELEATSVVVGTWRDVCPFEFF